MTFHWSMVNLKLHLKLAKLDHQKTDNIRGQNRKGGSNEEYQKLDRKRSTVNSRASDGMDQSLKIKKEPDRQMLQDPSIFLDLLSASAILTQAKNLG